MRILLYILIFFSVLNGWWFMALPLLLIGMWQYSFMIEVVISGIMYDALFGMVPSMGIWAYIGTIISLIIVGSVTLLKKVLR